METRGRSAEMGQGMVSAMRAIARTNGATRRRRRTAAALLGLAVGVLLGLLYAPRSRWMVAEQTRRGILSRPSGIPATDADILFCPSPVPGSRLEAALRTAAIARPDDAGMQTAITTMSMADNETAATAGDALRRFLPLLDRFPNTPEVHAAALRFAATSMARRDAGVPQRDKAWAFNHFTSIAKRGESLDPENAFFPMTRAAALYVAGGHEAEARAALAEAASRPEWRDGVEFEVRGAWRLADMACGYANPTARAAMTSRIGTGYNVLLRRAASAAMAQADEAARAGHFSESDAIRRDLLKAGERMRAQGSTLNIALAGIAMQRSAVQRDPAVPYTSTAYVDQDWNAWMARQHDAQGAVVRIAAAGLGHLDFEERLRRFSAWFALGQALMAGAFWTALLGAIVYVGEQLARNTLIPQVRRARDRGVATLAIVLAAVLALSAFAAIVGPMPDRAAGLGRLVPAIVIAIVTMMGHRRRDPIGHRVLRAFPRAALPVACALVLAYGGATLQTLRQEVGINRGLDAMVRHEGRFYAGLAGLDWPGE